MRQLTAWVDKLAVNAAVFGNRRSTADRLGVAERLERLDALVSAWHRDEWLADPDGFFGPPRTVSPTVRHHGSRWSRRVVDLSWDTGHRAIHPGEADVYEAFGHNRTVHARWFRSDRPRPTLVLVHGYLGGEFRSEQRVFPVRRWTRKGYDVALFALPFHGPRKAPGDKVRFPSSLPQVTIEGFRQAVADLRDLVGLLESEGVPRTAVLGMSLGGYTTALLATVEPRIDFAVPFIPLASLADYAAGHGRFIGSPAERALQHDQLERAYAVVSPLGRPALLPPDRLMVAGGLYDQITPIRHAERIATHFGCELIRFHGSHLVQIGRLAVWRRLEQRWPA